MLEAPIVQNKMGESVGSKSCLEVSVSFGRFDNDSLSWEKWSSFSPNKYLEEVEKCSTPGSVAQKKAYFEAHYKRIAAKKAAEEQAKTMGNEPLVLDESLSKDRGDEIELSKSDGEKLNESLVLDELKSEDCVADIESSKSDGEKLNASLVLDEPKSRDRVAEIKSSKSDGEKLNEVLVLDKPKSEDRVAEIESSKSDGEKLPEPVEEEPCFSSVLSNHSVDEAKEALSVEIVNEEVEAIEKADQVNEKGIIEKIGVKNPTFDVKNTSKKITPIKNEKNSIGTKKKPVSSTMKNPQISTPKLTKTPSNSTPRSKLGSSTKNPNGLLSSRSKISSAGESKRTPPSSLHMSMSLGSANSDSSSMRKSLIMEKMGDKEIVKRAFKTFQNNFNQLRTSIDEKSSGSKQAPVSTRGSDQKVSTSKTPQKENEGMRKAADRIKVQRSQVATRSNPTLSRSLNDVGLEKNNAKTGSSSIGLRGEKPRPSSKPKAEKETEIKKSLNFKATPLPGFSKGQTVSKRLSGKEGAKNEIRRSELHR